MKELKPYIESLFKKNNITVAKKHIPIFNEFLNNSNVSKMVISIQANEEAMLQLWKEKSMIEDIKQIPVLIPNATVGKKYEVVLDFEQPGLSEIGEYEILLPEKIGISCEGSRIYGVPKEAGEFMIMLRFKLKGGYLSYAEKEIKLSVNPDPKSLWQNYDSDKTDEYWKEDNISANAFFGSRSLVVGSKRGRSHAHEGKFRDDGFGFKYWEERNLGIIAVADGAGSARFSRKGSDIACSCIVDFFQNSPEDSFNLFEEFILLNINEPSEENQKKLSSYLVEQMGKAAFYAQAEIKKESLRKGAEVKDYSTTLIFVIIKKIQKKYVIASFWVGDGGVGIYNKNKNNVHVMGVPDSGEFAGQTRFLTMPEIFANGSYANRVRFKIVEDFTALILMTDGITDPKFQTDANLNKIEKWNELWGDFHGNNEDNIQIDFAKPAGEVESALLEWLDFWSAGNHDDRTIAILY